MTDDTLTRVRAALARLAEAERGATPGPWNNDDPWGNRRIEGPGMTIYDEGGHSAEDAAAIVALRNAAPALLALAEAVVRMRRRGHFTEIVGPADDLEVCIGCGAERLWNCTGTTDDPITHLSDCPAVAIDAVLAALADAPGEVQP